MTTSAVGQTLTFGRQRDKVGSWPSGGQSFDEFRSTPIARHNSFVNRHRATAVLASEHKGRQGRPTLQREDLPRRLPPAACQDARGSIPVPGGAICCS